MTAMINVKLSKKLPFLMAAITPNMIPKSVAIPIAVTAKIMVAGSAS
jgi:hypothetical protein